MGAPELHDTTAATIYGVHERRARQQQRRTYLGVSQLGHDCERFLWLSFRGALERPREGRLLRLFDTGHREEARLVEEMRAAGVTVSDRQDDGSQWAVEALGGHLRGHLDAALHNLPEAPAVWHVGEFKTHNKKSFDALAKHGVRRHKPMHWHQMNVYAGLTGMEWMLYVAVCKDDDRIHVERLEHDPADHERMLDRAHRVVFSVTPPPRAGENEDAMVCKWCDYRDICWGTDLPPAGCRTCAHATAKSSGGWQCERRQLPSIDDATQRAGCGKHRIIPVLLANFADAVDSDGESVTYRHRQTGRTFVNGDRPGYSSAEIHACADKRALGDPDTEQLRQEFDGVVCG